MLLLYLPIVVMSSFCTSKKGKIEYHDPLLKEENHKEDLTKILHNVNHLENLTVSGLSKSPSEQEIKNKLKEKVPRLQIDDIDVNILASALEIEIAPKPGSNRYVGHVTLTYTTNLKKLSNILNHVHHLDNLTMSNANESPSEQEIKNKLKEKVPQLETNDLNVFVWSPDSKIEIAAKDHSNLYVGSVTLTYTTNLKDLSSILKNVTLENLTVSGRYEKRLSKEEIKNKLKEKVPELKIDHIDVNASPSNLKIQIAAKDHSNLYFGRVMLNYTRSNKKSLSNLLFYDNIKWTQKSSDNSEPSKAEIKQYLKEQVTELELEELEINVRPSDLRIDVTPKANR